MVWHGVQEEEEVFSEARSPCTISFFALLCLLCLPASRFFPAGVLRRLSDLELELELGRKYSHRAGTRYGAFVR